MRKFQGNGARTLEVGKDTYQGKPHVHLNVQDQYDWSDLGLVLDLDTAASLAAYLLRLVAE